MTRSIFASFIFGIIVVSAAAFAFEAATDDAGKSKKISVGIIGVDTPHATAFTTYMNDPQARDARAGVTVTTAYVGGCDDVPESVKFRKDCFPQMKEMGVQIVPSIEQLLGKVDAVMIMTLDGRPHLAESKQVIAAGKPVYIGKPPVSPEEILEVYAFLASADASKNKGGTAVSVQSVLDEAKREISEREEK